MQSERIKLLIDSKMQCKNESKNSGGTTSKSKGKFEGDLKKGEVSLLKECKVPDCIIAR